MIQWVWDSLLSVPKELHVNGSPFSQIGQMYTTNTYNYFHPKENEVYYLLDHLFFRFSFSLTFLDYMPESLSASPIVQQFAGCELASTVFFSNTLDRDTKYYF